MSVEAEPVDVQREDRSRRDDEAERRRAAFQNASRGLNLPAGYQPPDEYEVSAGGVLYHGGRFGPASVASAPLLLTRVYVDPDGQESVEVVWRGRAGWVRHIVDRAEVASGSALVTALANNGLPVIASNGRQAERYLSALERCNHKVIPVEVLARWLGWQPPGSDGRRSFLCGPDGDRKVKPAVPEHQAHVLTAHRVHGTEAGWRAAVQLLDRFPLAVMVVAAAFAAPLLEPIGLPSFAVDIFGRSTRGKTTAARVAASVWGDPGDAGTLFSWGTTQMPAEARLNLYRGMSVVFDETQLVKSPAMVHEIIYSLEKGRSRARGKGWQSDLPFQVVLISTGERSLLTFTQDQGAAGRSLTLARPPLPAGDGHAAIAVALAEGVRGNYGHAGRAYVARLVDELNRADGPAQLRAAHAAVLAELVADLPPEADIARRRAPNLAAMILGARRAYEWGVMPVAAPPIAAWAEVFQAPQETDDRSEMALEVVRGYLAQHTGVIKGSPEAARNEPPGGWVGRMVDVESGKAVAILPVPLKTILEAEGYDLDAVRALWQDQGVLMQFKEGDRMRDTRPLRLGGATPRFHVFDPKHLTLTSDHE